MEVIRKLLEKPLFFYFVISTLLFAAFFIRVWNIDSIPKSPYWEEVALGYDAFSILKSGVDHHGNSFPIVAFESFGDWKPSGYFYVLVPFIWLFNLSVFSVRLPAVVAGTVLVALTGYLSYFVQSQLVHKKSNKKSELQSALLIGLAIAVFSPWLILFSRGGWEVTVATTFLYIGFISGLQVFAKKTPSSTWLLSCFIFLALSMYTYHATRVIAPLFGILLLAWWFTQDGLQKIQFHFSQKTNQKYVLLFVPALLLILLLPLLQSLGSNQVSQRFAETSILSNNEPIVLSNTLKESYGNAWWTKFIFHRYFFFASEIFSQALSHFTLDFLFVSGDVNPRHSVQMTGHMYIFEIASVLTGLYVVLRRNKKLFVLLLAMVTVIVFPSAISKAAPHALRTLPLAPLLISLSAAGWVAIYQKLKHPLVPTMLLPTAILSVYILFVSQFLHYYFVVYPQVQAHEWQYGYEKTVSILSQYTQENPESTIILSAEYGRPLMYYWFYTKADPAKVQEWSKSAPSLEKDQSELLSYENIIVIRPGRDMERLTALTETKNGKSILIAGSEEYIQSILAEIKSLNPDTHLTESEHNLNFQTVESPTNKVLWNFLELEIKNND